MSRLDRHHFPHVFCVCGVVQYVAQVGWYGWLSSKVLALCSTWMSVTPVWGLGWGMGVVTGSAPM